MVSRGAEGPVVAGFVGSANILHGVIEGGHVHLGAFRLPGAEHLHEESAATALVRPHDVWSCPRREPLGGIAFGTVVLVLQDGRVIQVETSEKTRLT